MTSPPERVPSALQIERLILSLMNRTEPSMSRTFTAVVLVAGLRYAFAEATAEGLWLQVSALLLELGVLSGERRLLVLGDGAAWIRTWFESLGISLKAMVLCWWRLRKHGSRAHGWRSSTTGRYRDVANSRG
jgi:hypothetical protein